MAMSHVCDNTHVVHLQAVRFAKPGKMSDLDLLKLFLVLRSVSTYAPKLPACAV